MSDRNLLRRGLALVTEVVRLHPVPFIVSVTGAVMFAAALVASSWVMGALVDRVISPTFVTGEVPPGALWWAVAAVGGTTLCRTAGVVFRRYYAGMTGERAQVSFRHDLTDRILGLPLAWHQETPTGELLALTDIDVEKSVDLIHPLPFSIGAGCIALFSLGYLITIDPYITLVALAVFPLLGGVNSYYGSRVEEPAAAGQEAVGKVSAIAHESFEGALVVKTLGRAEPEGVRFDEASQELRRHRIVVGYLRSFFEPMLDLIPSIGIVAAVVVSGYRIQAGAMTVGDMITVATLFSVLAFPVRVFGYFLESIPPSLVSRERLNRVLDEDATITERADGHTLGPGPLGLVADRVSFAYPNPETPVEDSNGAGDSTPSDGLVLSEVSFTIEPGEVVALVGSTGSGKSTLCQLLAGLAEPTAGSIMLGGVEIGSLAPAERTDALSMVFQESFMFADTIAANIDVAGTAGAAAVDQAAELAQASGFINDLAHGYDTLLGERGVNLSGGQRQRVALARALVRRPRLLILDDATSAVDPKVEQEILTGLRHQLDTTTLVVAQRVATIMLADRVLYLADRRIAASGTHAELMAVPGYENLVRAYELAGEGVVS